MRNAFADEITKLGAVNERVVLLSGDIGNKLFDKFKDSANGRFLNCGVAEANTRIRLATTQNIIAIARMNDGSFAMATKQVKVTIGGCGG